MQLGLDHEHAMDLWLWAARLWPLLLTPVFWFCVRAKLGKPYPFLVLGILVCFGVQQILGHVSAGLPVNVPTEAPFPEQFFQAILANIARIILFSSLLSLPLLWWLSHSLRNEKQNATTPNI